MASAEDNGSFFQDRIPMKFFCPCGNPRREERPGCENCWHSAPDGLRRILENRRSRRADIDRAMKEFNFFASKQRK